MKLGVELMVFGALLISTPQMIGGAGPTDDPFTNIMQKLPLNKVWLLRSMVISGVLFVMTGCAML